MGWYEEWFREDGWRASVLSGRCGKGGKEEIRYYIEEKVQEEEVGWMNEWMNECKEIIENRCNT